MSNQITTTIKPSGGSVGFSFNLNTSCSGSITHWLQYAPSGSENWFTVNVDPGKTGNITISCGQNDGHNYEMTLVPEVNGVECPGIKVSQTYVSCACSSVTLVEITYNVPSGGTSSRVEIGQYSLDANCDESSLKFTSPDGITLSNSNGKIYLESNIGEWDDNNPRYFRINYKYGTTNCDSVVLTQLGQEPCDCTTQVDYAIHTFRRTFKDSGTTTSESPLEYYEEEVASAHSFCGKISAATEGCPMLYSGYPKTTYDQATGNFHFIVAITKRPTTDGRSCTINFHFKKRGTEYSQYTPCGAYMVLEQKGNYCRCSNMTSTPTIAYRNDGPDGYRWAQQVTWTPMEHGSTGCWDQDAFAVSFSQSGNACSGCKCYKFNVAECTPAGALTTEDYYNSSLSGTFNLANNESLSPRTITARIQVLSDVDSSHSSSWPQGEVCWEKTVVLQQSGLPNCRCNDAINSLTLYDYGYYYSPTDDFTITSDSHGGGYILGAYVSTCYDYYWQYDSTYSPYGRWDVDTSNTASWINIYANGSSCNYGDDNAGLIAYSNESNPNSSPRSTTFDLVYTNRQSGGSCRKTITVTQEGSSGPGPGYECSCNSVGALGSSFRAPGSPSETVTLVDISVNSHCTEGSIVTDIDYEFDGGRPSWLSNVSIIGPDSYGDYDLVGKVAPSTTAGSRSVDVIITYKVNGTSCSDNTSIWQDAAVSCGCGYELSHSTLNDSTTKFTSGGSNNTAVIVGYLYPSWDENMIDRSCITCTVTSQSDAYATIVSTSFPKDGSYKEIKAIVKKNQTGDLQTCAINVNISDGNGNCFFGDIILKISGDGNLPT